MYVCLCKGITDHDIKRAVDSGARSFRQVSNATGVSSQCGKCTGLAKDIVNRAIADNNSLDSDLYYAVG